MSSHTKGPWKFNGKSQKGNSHFNVIGTNLGGMYKVARCPFNDEYDQKESEANAKLIAAAPEMAELLDKFATLNENYPAFKSISGLILIAREILTQLD